MPDLTLFIAVVFLLAGLVKGVTGLGLPTVAIAGLTVMMAPVEAAALIVVPSLVTNLWQMAVGPSLKGLARRFWPLLVGIGVGVAVGGFVFRGLDPAIGRSVLGITLLIYAGLGLAGPQLPAVTARAERWLGPTLGSATGVITSITGVFVMPVVPYLQTLGLGRDALVQALGLVFTVATLALGALLGVRGVLAVETAVASSLALAPALAGMAIGQWVRVRLSLVWFRRLFFAALAGLGLHLLIG
jgi:hypothetical protein